MTLFLLCIITLGGLSAIGQEATATEPEKQEKKYMVSFQPSVFDMVYLESRISSETVFENREYNEPVTFRHYALTFDLAVMSAANMIFGYKVSEQWWLLAVFGFKIPFGDGLPVEVNTGVGTRVDFTLKKGIGFCGVFFDYAYIDSDTGYHGINLLGFGGLEYLATDFFGIGAQLETGYLWYGISKNRERDLQGVILSLMGSMSFYF